MRFFALANAFKAGAMRFDVRDAAVSADELLAGKRLAKGAVEFILDSGRKGYDLLGGTHVAVKLISDRFKAALDEAGVTGWALYPVLLRSSDQCEIHGYSGLAVRGRASGRAGSDRIVRIPPVVPGGQTMAARVGIGVDETSWDGTDVFLLEGTRIVCVTERVKELIVSKRLTNVDLTDLNDYQIGYVSDSEL